MYKYQSILNKISSMLYVIKYNLTQKDSYYEDYDDDMPTCRVCNHIVSWGGCDTIGCPNCNLLQSAIDLRLEHNADPRSKYKYQVYTPNK